MTSRRCLTALLIFNTAALANSAELKQNTVAAWNRYIELAGGDANDQAFLRIDRSPEDRDRVHGGEILVAQVQAPNAPKVPDGMITDWIGTVFVPGATLADVLNVVWNYDQYPKWYGPTVAQAHLLARNGDEDRFSMLYVRTVLFVTVAIEMDYVAHHSPMDATHLMSISKTTHIYEIHDYGKPNQSKTPADDGSGYIWRVYSISKYEQRDNGVYIEQENIVLSQRIPAAYRWLVEPTIKRLAKNLLEGSLRQTREAVRSQTSH